jgi:hypothetical protein
MFSVQRIGKDGQGSDRGLTKVLSQHLSGETEAKHINLLGNKTKVSAWSRNLVLSFDMSDDVVTLDTRRSECVLCRSL